MAGSGAMTPRTFQIVVAAAKQLGIGKGGSLPWKLPPDMAFFKELTSATADSTRANAVIMGRKTWESIPPKFRPLGGRINVVLTREQRRQGRENNEPNSKAKAAAIMWPEGVEVCSSLDSALHLLSQPPWQDKVEHVFVIGGGQVYREALANPACVAVHMTHIDADMDCDTHLQGFDPATWRQWSATPVRKHKDLAFSYHCYVRAGTGSFTQAPKGMNSRHEESQYLGLIADIIAEGALRGDRTGTGTLSKFGCSLRFNLQHTFPLLTTKRVFWRGVAEELLWFISGSTNANILKDKQVGIWDGNSSTEYLASIGLSNREAGDLGPVYGFQWRHFGAEYTDMHADYRGQGVDQLANVVRQLRENPSDRRIILSAWNPAALPLMALPPCHMLCQFYVANGELSCQMVQRSADMGLGVPFNIASYALLTYLLAHVSGLTPGKLIIILGDAHVYANHVAPLQEQLQNSPFPFPELKINPDKREIDDFTYEDLTLTGYESHKKIPMQMAV